MKSFSFNQQSNVSLREKVTNDIRNAIITGLILPGSRLKETDIADEMGVSRGPVREAIRQLEREGLLISYPYRETIVADINAEEVKDVLIPIRFHLEWFVIKKYISQMDNAFFSNLQQIIDQMSAFIKDNKKDQIVELDVLFHEAIISLATERTVMLTWKSILNQTRLHFIKNAQFYKTEQFARDHQDLLDKLISKDLDLIQQELLHHMKSDEAFLCFLKI